MLCVKLLHTWTGVNVHPLSCPGSNGDLWMYFLVVPETPLWYFHECSSKRRPVEDLRTSFVSSKDEIYSFHARHVRARTHGSIHAIQSVLVPSHIGAKFKDLRTFAQLWPQLGPLPQERRGGKRVWTDRLSRAFSSAATICHDKAFLSEHGSPSPPLFSCLLLSSPFRRQAGFSPIPPSWSSSMRKTHFQIGCVCIGYIIS